jgi:hypothetical protein
MIDLNCGASDTSCLQCLQTNPDNYACTLECECSLTDVSVDAEVVCNFSISTGFTGNLQQNLINNIYLYALENKLTLDITDDDVSNINEIVERISLSITESKDVLINLNSSQSIELNGGVHYNIKVKYLNEQLADVLLDVCTYDDLMDLKSSISMVMYQNESQIVTTYVVTCLMIVGIVLVAYFVMKLLFGILSLS